jgi:hypothetical protein
MNSTDKTHMSTLSTCMERLKGEGYIANFRVETGLLKSLDKEVMYEPQEVKINNFYRFEGESDPSDTSILYAIETNDGTKGIIADAYGAYADEEVSDFFEKVEEIHKLNKR